jgi:hypothetical protein
LFNFLKNRCTSSEDNNYVQPPNPRQPPSRQRTTPPPPPPPAASKHTPDSRSSCPPRHTKPDGGKRGLSERIPNSQAPTLRFGEALDATTHRAAAIHSCHLPNSPPLLRASHRPTHHRKNSMSSPRRFHSRGSYSTL